MITKCKKCGCDALIKNGEWYECPKCEIGRAHV